MPNHVHVLVEQMVEFRLAEVVWAWKSFTAKKINRIREPSGVVWAREYHDRFIRDNGHFHSVISYIENNPVKAALVKHPEDWSYSSAARRTAGGTPTVPG
jgi:type I restriction enzyme R subunit/putative DNA methylase